MDGDHQDGHHRDGNDHGGNDREWIARLVEATERAAARLDPDGQPSHRQLHTSIVELQERLQAQLRPADSTT